MILIEENLTVGANRAYLVGLALCADIIKKDFVRGANMQHKKLSQVWGDNVGLFYNIGTNLGWVS